MTPPIEKKVVSKSDGYSKPLDTKNPAPSYKKLLKIGRSINPTGLLVQKPEKPKESAKESTYLTSKAGSVKSMKAAPARQSPIPPGQRPSIWAANSASIVRPKSQTLNPSKSSPDKTKRPHQSFFPSSGKKPKRRGKDDIPKDLVKLNTQKRDRASVEEIQNGIRSRKGLSTQSHLKERPRHVSDPPLSRKISATPVRRAIASASSEREQERNGQSSMKKRARSVSPPATKRNNYSSVIASIFGRNPRYDIESDGDSSDMEVGYKDVEREERRALKVAKREDLDEEKRGAR
jgi:hypothetical protein